MKKRMIRTKKKMKRSNLNEQRFKLMFDLFINHQHTEEGKIMIYAREKFDGDLLDELKKFGININFIVKEAGK